MFYVKSAGEISGSYGLMIKKVPIIWYFPGG